MFEVNKKNESCENDMMHQVTLDYQPGNENFVVK